MLPVRGPDAPFTVNVNPPLPAVALVGEMVEISGTGLELVTARTTEVALYVTCQIPLLSVGRFTVANVPETELAVTMVNEFPTAGLKPLIEFTLSVPPRATVPVTLT